MCIMTCFLSSWVVELARFLCWVLLQRPSTGRVLLVACLTHLEQAYLVACLTHLEQAELVVCLTHLTQAELVA